MCVLLVAWRLREDLPLFVAANRDESYARPAAAPAVLERDSRRLLMPRDLQAGGTWLGINDAGLTVVITNRPDGDFDAARPSRGRLCADALTLGSARDVGVWLESTLRRHAATGFNSFNLFYADTNRAFVSSWNGELRHHELQPGTHALSNEHGLGQLQVPELAALPWQRGDRDALRGRVVDLLGDHTDRDPQGYRICKHGTAYGTRSSALLVTPAAATAWLEYAPGPPCRTPFQRYALTSPESQAAEPPPER